MQTPTQRAQESEPALAPPTGQPPATEVGGTTRLQALVRRILANGAAAGTEALPASILSTHQQADAGQAAAQQAEGSLSSRAAPVSTPAAQAEARTAGTAAAAAAAAVAVPPCAATPAATVVVKTEYVPDVGSGPAPSPAAGPALGARAQPAGDSWTTSRGRWPVGVSQDRCGDCLVRISAPLDNRGMPSVGATRQEVVVRRVLSGLGAAAVARDLALMWRQLGLGQPLAAAREVYNHALPSLKRHESLLRQACASLADLQALLERLDGSGQLRSMAAALAGTATDPQAAAAAAAAPWSPPAARRRGAKRPRQQGAGSGGAGTAGAEAGRTARRAGGQQRQAGGDARGPAHALGRRVRVWLTLDDGICQEHQGRVVEVTPSGKHHVLFDDGEEALLDPAQADFEFTSPPDPAAVATAAAAAAAGPVPDAAADVGQRLLVWWPEEGRAEGAWYGCRVTHVLRNGMHCVRYEVDGSELLLDTHDPETRLQWDRPQRQQRWEAAHRGRQAQQQGRRQRAAQLREERQQGQPRDREAAPVGERQAPPAAAVPPPGPGPRTEPEGSPDSDIFLTLMDAASQPAAAAAGLTPELLGSYAALFDTLPPADQARNEQRIRFLLASRQCGGAAALMRAAVELRLGRLAAA